MDYDPTRDALLRPQLRDTIFVPGHALPPSAICAELSRLAYTDLTTGAGADRLQTALARGGLGVALPFAAPGTGTQGFVVTSSNGQDAYFAFRGTQTDDVTDIGTDLEVAPKAWPGGGKVHTGFFDALESVWPAIQRSLDACAAPRLWFTGHSLGAALATLAMQRAGRPGGHLVTFGSPRVGDQDFADLFAALEVERYVNCCDIVTYLPPSQVFGYAHIAKFRYIDEYGALHPTAPSNQAIRDDQLAGWLDYKLTYLWQTKTVALRNLADHSPINYIRAFVA